MDCEKIGFSKRGSYWLSIIESMADPGFQLCYFMINYIRHLEIPYESKSFFIINHCLSEKYKSLEFINDFMVLI